MKSVRSRILEFVDANPSTQQQHIWFHEDHTEVYRSEGNLKYFPSPTAIELERAVLEDGENVTCVMGPFGSGKSTMMMHFLVKETCNMPVWSGGRRRARAAFIRNTSGELESTTLKTWEAWFGELGDVSSRQKPVRTHEHVFSDGKGLVELEVLFLALDRPADVGKLKSLDLTWIFLNELCEIHKSILDFCTPRVKRYPSKVFCSENYRSAIICDTNPPSEDHWIASDFLHNPIKGYRLITQPPGLRVDEKGNYLTTTDGDYIANPDADNIKNLKDPDYYPVFARGKGLGFIKAFCQGQFSLVEMGKRVYPEYNDDVHSVDHVDVIPELPIHLGWDFGLTPACVVVQVTARGQLRVLKEYVSDRIGIRNFAKLVVIPDIKQRYPGIKIGYSDADPAGKAGDTIVEELSCIGELIALGIPTEEAMTNDPVIRQAAVRFFLTSYDGSPLFLLDRKEAPTLRKGFVSGYVFRQLRVPGELRYSEEPDKNMYSHSQDGLQYTALRFATISLQSQKPQSTYRPNRTFNFG